MESPTFVGNSISIFFPFQKNDDEEHRNPTPAGAGFLGSRSNLAIPIRSNRSKQSDLDQFRRAAVFQLVSGDPRECFIFNLAGQFFHDSSGGVHKGDNSVDGSKFVFHCFPFKGVELF